MFGFTFAPGPAQPALVQACAGRAQNSRRDFARFLARAPDQRNDCGRFDVRSTDGAPSMYASMNARLAGLPAKLVAPCVSSLARSSPYLASLLAPS